jgi:hypothetical protein
VRLTARATWADPVARLLFAWSYPLAHSVEEWETRRGGSFALPRRFTASGGRGPRARQPPSGFVLRPPSVVPSHPRWGAYFYSSRVSVACGQQLDWRGVRHTRELCGDADPRGHLRESYAPSISIKSASDLDCHHMPWDYLEHNNSRSPLGAANNHVRLRQTSTRMTTLFSTPLLGGALFRAAFDAVSSSTGAGLATPENVSPPDT